MKRLLLISVISMLFVSGWGHVLGLAFCTNMQAANMRAMPGCAMQRMGEADTAASSAASHEGMKMPDMQAEQVEAKGLADSLAQPLASCCAGRPDLPPSPVFASRGAEQSKKELGAIRERTPKAISPPEASFAPPVSSRQHAPPTAKAQRHVLISVFLI